MIDRPVKFILGVFTALAFALPVAVQADDTPPPLAEMWLVTPKASQAAEFRKALVEHMAFRSEHEDPRNWEVYTPMLGDDLGRYGIRYCCFEWADQDSYDAWQDEAVEVSKHFLETVAPLTEKWAHYFEDINWGDSHWVASDTPYRFYAVTEFNIKPGHGRDFAAARNEMSQIALNQGWATDQHPWIWASTIGGDSREAIIIPHLNYASFDRGDDNFVDFLSKHMGAEKASELLKQFASSASSTDFQVWEYHEELSMSPDD